MTVYFVDIKGRAIHRFDPVTQSHCELDLPKRFGCIGGPERRFRLGPTQMSDDGGIRARGHENPLPDHRAHRAIRRRGASFPHSGSLFVMRLDVPGLGKPLFDPNV